MSRWLAWGLAATVLGLGAITLTRTGLLVWTTHSSMIHGDGFGFLTAYADFMAGRMNAVEYFWRQHTEHRHGPARILFAVDAWAVGGTQALEKAATALALSLSAALFVGIALRQSALPWSWRLVAVGLLAILFGSNQKMEVLNQGFTNVFATFVLFSTLAFLLTARAVDPARLRAAPFLLALACVCAFLAAYSYAPGLWVCAIMALQCLAFRRWRAATSVLIVGLLIGGSYFWRYQAPATDLWAVFKQPLVLLHYIVAYVGNPLGALGLGAATVAGAIALALLAGFIILAPGFDRKDRPAISFLLAVCALGLGTAFLTALGRLQLGLAYAIGSRYSALIEPMWAALLLMGLLWLKGRDGAAIRRTAGPARAIPFAAAGLLCAALVFGQGYWSGAAGAYRERWEVGATAAIVRAPDRQALQGIALEGEALDRWIGYLAERQLSVFASEADRTLYRVARGFWTQPVTALGATHGKWCAGRLDPGTKVPGTQTWYRFGGYALDREAQSAADGIVLADRDGSVIGIARPLAARPDLDDSLGLRSKGLKLYFVGYGEPSTGPVTAYALKLGRDSLCSIGEG